MGMDDTCVLFGKTYRIKQNLKQIGIKILL